MARHPHPGPGRDAVPEHPRGAAPERGDGGLPANVRRAAWAFVDFVFPPRCGGCRRLGARFCEACRRSIAYLHLPVCPRCGCPLAEAAQGCWCQPASLASLRGIRAAAYHEGPLRLAIHQLKYSRDAGLAESLGALLHVGWQTHSLSGDVIVPVPLARDRQRLRGFNQAALLAQVLSTHSGRPVESGVLERVRETEAQVGGGWRDRWDNVTGAFRCRSDRAVRVAGRVVVLVDDVCTTGATFTASAGALLDAGAAEVWGLALARPRREPGVRTL